MGYSLSGYKESDTTEWLSTRTHTHRINTHGRGDQKVTKLCLLAPCSAPALMGPPLHFHLPVHGLFDNSAAKLVALWYNSRYFKTQSWHVFQMNWKHLKISTEEAKGNWSPNHLNRNWQTQVLPGPAGRGEELWFRTRVGWQRRRARQRGFVPRTLLPNPGRTDRAGKPTQAQLRPNPWQAQLGGGAQGSWEQPVRSWLGESEMRSTVPEVILQMSG